MKKKSVYENSKLRKNNDKYAIKGIQGFNQTLVADDIKRKNNQNKISYNFDEKMFIKGREWFENGFLLEDAPKEFETNPSFRGGFRKGERLALINSTLYEMGIEFYNRGVSIDDIPQNYRNNTYFMNGYNNSNKKIR